MSKPREVTACTPSATQSMWLSKPLHAKLVTFQAEAPVGLTEVRAVRSGLHKRSKTVVQVFYYILEVSLQHVSRPIAFDVARAFHLRLFEHLSIESEIAHAQMRLRRRTRDLFQRREWSQGSSRIGNREIWASSSASARFRA